MKKLLTIVKPLEYIKEQPYQFIVWFLVAIILGLIGFWAPMLINKLLNQQIVINNIVKTGVLASFSIIILADGIVTTLVAKDSGKSNTTAGIRGFFGIIAVLLVVLNIISLVL